MSKKNELDQYYTNPDYAKKLSKLILDKAPCGALFIEPSAGTGSFSRCFESILSFDLEPKFDGCIRQDFLSLDMRKYSNSVVVGNPPFGKNSSLAVKFFNHASIGASMICFILPRTFQKMKFTNRLNPYFHKVYEEICPEYSFILDDSPYDVPCVFQIWEKRDYMRELFSVGENVWFSRGTKENHDFAVRRVGGRAGKIVTGDLNENSTYFLKVKHLGVVDKIKSLYNVILGEATKSAGVRSIGLEELQYILDTN